MLRGRSEISSTGKLQEAWGKTVRMVFCLPGLLKHGTSFFFSSWVWDLAFAWLGQA